MQTVAGCLTTTTAMRALEIPRSLTVVPACTGGVWETTGIYPQLWVESRSLTPTLAGTARALGVSLYPSGGMSTDTFVHEAVVDAINTGREHMVVVYVGDYDPAGLLIADNLEKKLVEHLDYAAEDYDLDAPELTFERVAITEGGYVNRCVNDIRRRPSQPLIQWRFHPHTVHRGRRLRSTQGPSDA